MLDKADGAASSRKSSTQQSGEVKIGLAAKLSHIVHGKKVQVQVGPSDGWGVCHRISTCQREEASL